MLKLGNSQLAYNINCNVGVKNYKTKCSMNI